MLFELFKMQKNYTVFPKRQITYEWIIKDFKDHLSFYENAKANQILYSSNFSPIKNDADRFHLQLRFNSNEMKNWLSCILHWKKFDQPVKMKSSIYILNNKREKYNEFVLIQTSAKDNIDWAYIKFCEKRDLLFKAEELLPDNTLTLGCDLTIYDDAVNIKPIYEYKPQCSMEFQFKELLESQACSDFSFDVNDQEFKVHKLILMTRSPVFKAMIENEMIEKNNNRALIIDICPKIFKIMLEFIYTDKVEVNLSKDDTINLFIAADKYQLDDLKGICEKKFNEILGVDNALEIFSFAQKYKIEQLITNTKNFMKIYQMEVLNFVIMSLSEHHSSNNHN